MKAIDIIESIENGEYEIIVENECDCQFIWEINEQNRLTENTHNGNCWCGKQLFVDGMEIVYHYYGYIGKAFGTAISEIDEGDIPEDLINEIVDYIKEVPKHVKKRKLSLISFLKELVAGGARLYLDNLNGLSKQTTCIIVMKDNPIVKIDDWEEMTPFRWANEFLFESYTKPNPFFPHKIL